MIRLRRHLESEQVRMMYLMAYAATMGRRIMRAVVIQTFRPRTILRKAPQINLGGHLLAAPILPVGMGDGNSVGYGKPTGTMSARLLKQGQVVKVQYPCGLILDAMARLSKDGKAVVVEPIKPNFAAWVVARERYMTSPVIHLDRKVDRRIIHHRAGQASLLNLIQ